MPFPKTRRLLREAGYDFISVKVCPCGSTMELWHSPNDRIIPMNPMADDEAEAVSHFATCPKAVQFRRPKPNGSAAATPHVRRPG